MSIHRSPGFTPAGIGIGIATRTWPASIHSPSPMRYAVTAPPSCAVSSTGTAIRSLSWRREPPPRGAPWVQVVVASPRGQTMASGKVRPVSSPRRTPW
jgi:hypothetical protein